MKVPTVGSVVKVRAKYSQGPMMIPPRPDFIIFEGTVLPSYKWLSDKEFCMSGDNDYPVRVISMSSVEHLDLVSGEFKEINSSPQSFIVAGSKGTRYTVTRTRSSYTCTCPGFTFRKTCRHIQGI